MTVYLTKLNEKYHFIQSFIHHLFLIITNNYNLFYEFVLGNSSPRYIVCSIAVYFYESCSILASPKGKSKYK